MHFISLAFSFLSIMLNMYSIVKVYGEITSKKVNFNFVNIIPLFVFTFATFINNYYQIPFLKLFLSIFIVLLMLIYYFREELSITLFKLFLIYVVLYLCDFSISFVFVFFPFNSLTDLGGINVLKGLCTILVSLILMLIFSINFFVNFLNKLIKYVKEKLNFLYVIVPLFTLLVFIVLVNLYSYVLDFLMFSVVLLILFVFSFLCVIMIFQYFKNKHNEEEQKSLLDLMNEYERMLDHDRINKHEMLNNLVTLKTFKNKSSKEYELLLDDIISDYQFKKSEFYSKLYKLPSGVKGIIYYKIANIKDKDINIELLISKNVKNRFENLNSRLYFRVCKILGIILDNAIEATSESESKNILIDIYLEDENIIFYIENSFNNNIDLDKITEKGESSKGSNRGYGLFIANKLVKEKDDITFSQHIEGNNFISILTIKNLQ